MSQSPIVQSDVYETLAESLLMATPDAAKAITEFEDPQYILEEVVESTERGSSVGIEDVNALIKTFAEEQSQARKETAAQQTTTKDTKDSKSGQEVNSHNEPIGETVAERWPVVYEKLFGHDLSPVSPRGDPKYRSVEISGDITGKSTCTGTYAEFNSLFTSRYEKLERILRKQLSPIDISALRYRHGMEVSVIGMVRRVWTTQKQNRLVEIESPEGVIRTVFTDEEEKEKTERVLTDEVVGIEGTLSDDGGIIFGETLTFPDVPYSHSINRAERSVKAAFISDVHLGADTFAYDKWNSFIEWINTEPEIEYLLIGGDLVEGIGVYPNQEEELDVVDITDQYRFCAQSLSQLPEDLEIISIVGNHDTGTRLAEPQPAVESRFTELFPDNVTIVGNPATVTLEGVNILMYHGMSIHPLAEGIPGMTQDTPTDVMKLMLEKRHLAPMYGQNVRLAPEPEDHLVIEDVPDVLHCGHVHKFGVDEYRGVKLFNTSCWQYQTDFQKSKDISPDVGYVTVMDLLTHECDYISF